MSFLLKNVWKKFKMTVEEWIEKGKPLNSISSLAKKTKIIIKIL